MNNRVRTIKRYYDKHPGEYDYEVGRMVIDMSRLKSPSEAWNLLAWLANMNNKMGKRARV